MKKSFFSLLLIFAFITSCQTQADTDAKAFTNSLDKLVSLKSSEREKGNYNESIFLDFKLGMSKAEATETVVKLTKEGKFVTNEEGKKVYLFSVPDNNIKIETGIYPVYHDDKLYKLILNPVPQRGQSLVNDNTVFSAIRSLYLKKYGNENLVEMPTILADETDLHWINKNLEIKVSMSAGNGTMVEYKDHLIDSQLELKKLDEKAKADSLTTNDI